ncbi:phage portal protein [Micromonospora aurantiaca]|uniref:phage portal protein n=1 Tax=Micromonospora aurantiaca (nom. illeg.) TaxID=47850 RepID=UPI003428EF92
MGLGRMLTTRARPSAPAAEEHNRVITEFAIIDGVAVDGSGESGTRYRGGMSIPGAWRCAVLLSDLLGQIPWDAFRSYGGQTLERIAPRPPLLEQPNPPDTRMTSFSSWGLDLIWHGNAVGIIAARNAYSQPTAAIPVPAEQVGVRRITRPGMSSVLPIGALEYSIGTMRLGSHEVIHIKGPCQPGAVRGMGVLEAHMETLDLAREQARQARSVSSHGVPTGVLKSENPDLTAVEAKDLKTKWMDSQRDRTIAVLNATTSFEPLAWNPEELQLLDARKFSLHELALIFGVPLSFLGVETSNRTYRSDVTEAINLLKFSLGGHLARFEQTLSLAFPRGTVAAANLDAILRADVLTRYQAYAIGLDKQFLGIDEVRLDDRRGPMPAKPKPRPAQPADDPTTDPTGEQP